MERTYTHHQRQRGCEMELKCKKDFARYGINLIEYGNCVACYCTTGCDECVDDENCKPDFKVPDLKVSVETTGYNPANPHERPGLRFDWPLNVTKCKVENFIYHLSQSETDVCYVYHYSNITAFNHRGGKEIVPVLTDHIRIIKMDEIFVEAYMNREFDIKPLKQDVMVCVQPQSKYVIYPGQMFQEIGIMKIASQPGWG